jgi:hypothetical protein
MHRAAQLLPEFQDRQLGDVVQLGKKGPRLPVDVLDAERAMVLRSEDGHWVWAFCLIPMGPSTTRFISRSRILTAGASLIQRLLQSVVMEPGNLLMERKMLIGIKQRAEVLTAIPHAVRREATSIGATSHQPLARCAGDDRPPLGSRVSARAGDE